MKIFILIVILIFIFGILCIWDYKTKNCPICPVCYEKVTDHGIQWQKWWLHERCYSELEKQARFDIGAPMNERSPRVAKRITFLIEERLKY